MNILKFLISKILKIENGVYYINGSETLPPPLTQDEEAEMIKDVETKEKNRKILVEHNLRLVVYIAKRFENTGVGIEDLISIGTIGLIKAVNTYRSGRSTRLATYAARCIENEILMVIRSSKKTASEVSINVPIGTDKDGNEISLNDILGTEPDAIADDLNLKIQIGHMIDALRNVLDEREKTILIHRYGILGTEPKTQREVAAHLGISRSYVSRIEKKAMEKLRTALQDFYSD